MSSKTATATQPLASAEFAAPEARATLHQQDQHHGALDEFAIAAGRLMGRFAWWWPWLPAGGDKAPMPESLTLPDGTRAWIRPVQPSDRDLHAKQYERLSEDSKYSRFLSPVAHLSDELLTLLVDDVDGVDHVAYYLFVEGDESELPVATGRIVRDPEDPAAADVAVTVLDEWHGRGIATALLEVLVARRPAGVTRIVTIVLAGNRASRRMLRRIGPTRETPIGGGTMEVRVSLQDLPST